MPRLTTIFRKFCILDFILAAVFLVISEVVQATNRHEAFIPSVTSDISEKLHSTTIHPVFHYLFLYAICPLVIVFSFTALIIDNSVFRGISAYLFSVCFSSALTAISSYFVGRPRPDTLAVCGGLGSFQECAQVLTEKKLIWQFNSFPSIRVTEMTSACAFLSLLFADFNHNQTHISTAIKLLPICLAAFVAACEILDRRAHVDDAVVGAFIGGIIAAFSYNSFKVGITKSPTNELSRLKSQSDSVSVASNYV